MEKFKQFILSNKVNSLIVLVIVAILGVYFYNERPTNIQLPGAPIVVTDEWTFSQKVTVYEPVVETPTSIIQSITLTNVVLFLSFLFVYLLIFFSLRYFVYGMLGSFDRFSKYTTPETKHQFTTSLRRIAIGTVMAGVGTYLMFNYSWSNDPISVAQSLVTILAFILSSLYVAISFFILSIRSVFKTALAGDRKRTLVSVSYLFSSIIFIMLYIATSLFDAFFGINILGGLEIPDATRGSYNSGTGLLGTVGAPSTSGIGLQKSVSENIGFSVGGAKDVNNFRTNINNNYLPLVTDITFEGLFFDYHFDTGQNQPCTDLFCPSYSYSISPDPISETQEYYLSVGLNSGIKQSEFSRKKLNLVIVLDISGSMGSPFDQYYYDQFGGKIDYEKEKVTSETKMQIANKSVVALLDHLNPEDRYGMVLFDDIGYLAKPMLSVENTNIQNLKDHILEIQPQGGTNMEAGYEIASDVLSEFTDSDKTEYENRIIFLTDAQPNTGMLSEGGLLNLTKTNAEKGIYTSFVGIGLDFNSELIEFITKVKGSNYYSVHTAEGFKTRMDEGFEFMVTPLVFDLNLKVESQDFKIEKVFGSPEADLATGEIMKVNTLFPSERTSEGVKGGIVLLKLRKTTDSPVAALNLTANYLDRNNVPFSNAVTATITDPKTDFYYQNTGIRKAITLSRYASLMKVWISEERDKRQVGQIVTEPSITTEKGIILPESIALSKWERASVPLVVSDSYKALFTQFKAYFEAEIQAVGDNTLSNEVTLINKLLSK